MCKGNEFIHVNSMYVQRRHIKRLARNYQHVPFVIIMDDNSAFTINEDTYRVLARDYHIKHDILVSRKVYNEQKQDEDQD